jgi:hypothetical protein
MSHSKSAFNFKHILFSRGMALAVIFMIVFTGYGVVSIAGKSFDAARARKSSEAQSAALKDKSESMSRKLEAINTPEGKEAALREQFPVVKAGEHVVVITEEQPAAVILAKGEGQPTPKGFWNFLKNLFN